MEKRAKLREILPGRRLIWEKDNFLRRTCKEIVYKGSCCQISTSLKMKIGMKKREFENDDQKV